MNKKLIKESLSKFEDQEVNNYIVYLSTVEKDQKNMNWIGNISDKEWIHAFKKVKADGLTFDGDTVTFQYRGKLLISYNFQAYKNKVLVRYPKSKFDLQLVHAGDTTSFEKNSGSVIYKHIIADPFGDEKDIVGAYCVIKNERGEFLETINKVEISKMRSVAKTQAIWNKWEGEMILKSVTKRACKRHFKDLVERMDKTDNENYDIEGVESEVTDKIKKEISSFEDEMDLLEYANDPNMRYLSNNDEFRILIHNHRTLIIERNEEKNK